MNILTRVVYFQPSNGQLLLLFQNGKRQDHKRTTDRQTERTERTERTKETERERDRGRPLSREDTIHSTHCRISPRGHPARHPANPSFRQHVRTFIHSKDTDGRSHAETGARAWTQYDNATNIRQEKARVHVQYHRRAAQRRTRRRCREDGLVVLHRSHSGAPPPHRVHGEVGRERQWNNLKIGRTAE